MDGGEILLVSSPYYYEGNIKNIRKGYELMELQKDGNCILFCFMWDKDTVWIKNVEINETYME